MDATVTDLQATTRTKVVVVPIDDLTEADRAVEIGGHFAHALGARLHLVSVDSVHAHPIRHDHDLADVARRSRRRATYEALTTSTSVDAAVRDAVDAMDCPLVCITSHARSAIGELAFTSASWALVRASRRPVIVSGPNARWDRLSGSTVVVALDGSDHDRTIVDAAILLANQAGVHHLHLITIITDTNAARMADRLIGHAQRIDRIGMVASWELDATHGAAPGIRHAAAMIDAPLTVVGTRGHTPLQRLIHGSTAAEVVRGSHRPVLIVPPCFEY